MFEPVRGGTRGGQGEFKWTDVSADKDREHYLGHSINAPTGRWQKNKDVHWYNRDLGQTEDERAAEIRKVKEAEADALAVALGFAPAPKLGGEGSGGIEEDTNDDPVENPRHLMEREEKKRRKEEKRARKEMKRLAKSREKNYHDGHSSSRRRHSRSRSRSPQPTRDRSRERIRDYRDKHYGEADREHERTNQRRQWERNVAKRDGPMR